MLADIRFFESLQTGGTVGYDVSTFNSSLPFLFSEFQKAKKVSDRCSEIVDSVKDEEGGAVLVTAVSEAKRKCDENLFSLKQKIAKEIDDGIEFSDRQVFFSLDRETQDALKLIVASDTVLREAILAQQTPKQ